MEVCFDVEEWCIDNSYKYIWLDIVKNIATRNNMLHKIKFFIRFDDEDTIQVKPKCECKKYKKCEYVSFECIESHVKILTTRI